MGNAKQSGILENYLPCLRSKKISRRAPQDRVLFREAKSFFGKNETSQQRGYYHYKQPDGFSDMLPIHARGADNEHKIGGGGKGL